jgi:hypothetical protein
MGRFIKFFEWLADNPPPQCEQNEALPDVEPYEHKHIVDVSKLPKIEDKVKDERERNN